MKEKIFQLLGLAFRANKIVTGEDNVIHALQKKIVKIVFIASDCSNKTIDTFEKKCFFYKIPCNKMFSSDEISRSLGKIRKIIALCDEGFYMTYQKYMRGE